MGHEGNRTDLELDGGACADGPAPAGDEAAELRAEIESLRGQLLRLRADTDNYRKRLERTTQDLARQARREILLSVLGMVDDLDRALAAARCGDQGGSLREGVELTLARVHGALRSHGIRPLESAGTFDPRLHEAVGTVSSAGLEEGSVVEEVQRGYWWGDEVLRAARVLVAVAPSE